MSGERQRRVGQNEALYRQVNEPIEDLNEVFGSGTGDFAIVCECGNLACVEQLSVPRELYERTRANPSRFIVKPEHEENGVETIVEAGQEYSVVEKDEPHAPQIAQVSDPRSKDRRSPTRAARPSFTETRGHVASPQSVAATPGTDAGPRRPAAD